jgi:hypothetical protein
MRRQLAIRNLPESVGQRLAGPAVVLGSLFAIALMLYVLDTMPLGQLLP